MYFFSFWCNSDPEGSACPVTHGMHCLQSLGYTRNWRNITAPKFRTVYVEDWAALINWASTDHSPPLSPRQFLYEDWAASDRPQRLSNNCFNISDKKQFIFQCLKLGCPVPGIDVSADGLRKPEKHCCILPITRKTDLESNSWVGSCNSLCMLDVLKMWSPLPGFQEMRLVASRIL